MLCLTCRETEYLMKNMEASVKDSAASNRQELELQKQKVNKLKNFRNNQP